MVKVSIILPIYNVAPYLDDAFQSLINQTLKDIEIIAINDGSTDDSQSYIDKYAELDSRIHKVYQENKGLSGARNTGLQYIHGEYVYFMDSDDILEKNALETCYKYATTNPADVFIFDANIFYEKNANKIAWAYDRSNILEDNHNYNGRELFNYLLETEQHRAVVWLQFIKWDFFNNLHLDFYQGIIHEDELFTSKLLLQTNNVVYINKKLIMHRIRNNSIQGINYSERNINCYLTVIDELLKWQNSPVIHKFAHYTLSKVFYTGHVIPFKDKISVFFRAMKSGYLKYIGLKSCLIFWLKQ